MFFTHYLHMFSAYSKILGLVLCFFCVISSQNLRAGATISTEITSTQNWNADGGTVIFTNAGALNVNTNGAAANVSGTGSLSINFQNDPTVETSITSTNDAGNEVPVNAHIYAYNTTNNGSAVGINLADGASLGIDSTISKTPVLAAYSNVSSSSIATLIKTNAEEGGSSNITVSIPSRLYVSSSSSSNGNGYSYSGSAVFGVAVGDGSSASLGGTNEWSVGNNNTLTASSSGKKSSAAVFGAAVGDGSSVASSIAINMNGSETLSALSYGGNSNKVNIFGADSTDKGENSFGWRVGIFASGSDIATDDGKELFNTVSGNSTVNILGAKLNSAITVSEDKAQVTLSNNQGSSSSDYARAFALGNDFQIYIGGRAVVAKNEGNVSTSFESVVPSSGTINTVNILGAISKVQSSADTNGSSLTIDNGWVVNTYGPVKDLSAINVTNGVLYIKNNLSSINNVTISKDGKLVLCASESNADSFNSVVSMIQGKMVYVDPSTGNRYKGEDGAVSIDANSYPWRGTTAAQFALSSGATLKNDGTIEHNAGASFTWEDDSWTNDGTFNVMSDAEFAVAKEKTLINDGALTNSGTVSIASGATLTNDGGMVNNGTLNSNGIILLPSKNSKIENSGEITLFNGLSIEMLVENDTDGKCVAANNGIVITKNDDEKYGSFDFDVSREITLNAVSGSSSTNDVGNADRKADIVIASVYDYNDTIISDEDIEAIFPFFDGNKLSYTDTEGELYKYPSVFKPTEDSLDVVLNCTTKELKVTNDIFVPYVREQTLYVNGDNGDGAKVAIQNAFDEYSRACFMSNDEYTESSSRYSSTTGIISGIASNSAIDVAGALELNFAGEGVIGALDDGEGNEIGVHIVSSSGNDEDTGNGYSGIVGINLEDNASLSITAESDVSPTIIIGNEQYNVPAVVAIKASKNNNVTIEAPSRIYSIIKASSSDVCQVAATVIGDAESGNANLEEGVFNIRSSNNHFYALAGGIIAEGVDSKESQLAASSVFGVTSVLNDAKIQVNNNWAIRGQDNNFIAFAHGTDSSAGVVFGAANVATDESTKFGIGEDYNHISLDSGNMLSAFADSAKNSAVAVVGAASYDNNSSPSIAINMNGSETLSALSYGSKSIKVNIFGADSTDKEENSFGWRVGIFASGEEIKDVENKTLFNAVSGNSTVNILGAKLNSAITVSEDKAQVTLSGDQGNSSSDYARAFALGNDFQIYIGGRAIESTEGIIFESIAPAGGTNTVNILGAISKGQDSSDTDGSSLTIDNGWVVNTYGPVEDLNTVNVTNGTFNVRNKLSVDGGMTVDNGSKLVLCASESNATSFNSVIGDIQNKVKYADTDHLTEIGVNIDSENYPWRGQDGGTMYLNSKLTLKNGAQFIVEDGATLNLVLDEAGENYSNAGSIVLSSGDSGEYGKVLFNGEDVIDFVGSDLNKLDLNESKEKLASSRIQLINVEGGANLNDLIYCSGNVGKFQYGDNYYITRVVNSEDFDLMIGDNALYIVSSDNLPAIRIATLYAQNGAKVIFPASILDLSEDCVELKDELYNSGEDRLSGTGYLVGMKVESVAVDVASSGEGPLVLDFSNAPAITTGIINNGGKKINAHIYAYNTADNGSAIGINLADGASLEITSDDDSVIPTLAAYSKASVYGSSASVLIKTNAAEGGSSDITVSVPSRLYSSSSSYSNSSAAVFGAASGDSSASIGGTNIWSTGDNNVLTASSGTDSGSGGSSAVVFGAASSNGNNVSVEGTNTWSVGDSNALTASSSSSNYYSSAVVFGAASSGSGSASVKGTNEWSVGNDNTLTASSSSSGYSSSAVVFGAASANGTSVASGIAVNMNGSETLSALSYESSSRVNVFGADSTDKGENSFGWRVGIFASGSDITADADADKTLFNAVSGNSTVNILGAKLSSAITVDENKAQVALSGDQGSSSSDYARAFALGNDFQIYVGGRAIVSKGEDGSVSTSFESVAPAGETNTVNIFGAIAPAGNASKQDVYLADIEVSRIKDSSLTIDNGWTVNVYGPVEGLESINIKNGTMNTYGSLKDITLEGGGTINVYGKSEGVGTICLKEGVLKLNKCDNNGAESVLKDIAGKMKVSQDGQLYPVEMQNTEEYVKSFGTSGKLVLNKGDSVVFHIDSSKKDESINSSGDGFELVKGYIEIDSSLPDAIDFNGGKLYFVDDNENKDETLDLDVLFIRTPGMTIQDVLGTDEVSALGFQQVDGHEGLWQLIDPDKLTIEEAKDDSQPEVAENTVLKAASTVARARSSLLSMVNALSEGTTETANGLKFFDNVGLGMADVVDASTATFASTEEAKVCMNSAMASINTSMMKMFRSSFASRLSDVKGNGNDPFLSVIGGHLHQGQIDGIGYSVNVYGVAGGADKLLKLSQEKYLKLGVAIGYIYGDADFKGNLVNTQTAKEDLYVASVYGAYESFDKKNLKTDINVFLGFGYGESRLKRVDSKSNVYSGTMKSHNESISIEFIKNLYAIHDVQIGLWLKMDYNHIHQRGYSEKGNKSFAKSVSKANFDLLNTTVGVNIERELQNFSNEKSRLRLYMKAGWNCQPVRDSISGVVTNASFVPNVSFGSRNTGVVAAGFREKFNEHWDMVGEWNGTFSRKQSDNVITLGLGYSF